MIIIVLYYYSKYENYFDKYYNLYRDSYTITLHNYRYNELLQYK
jgi:hypothetical protein